MASRRRTIFTGLATVIGASVLAGCSVVGPVPFVDSTASNAAVKPVAVPLRERAGISAGSSILWEGDDVRLPKLQAVADSGARWFEFDIDWNSIQAGGQYSFDWSATDRVVLAARARGLKILGMAGYSPGWARPANCPPNTDKCLPKSPEYYAQFVKAAALRYGATSPIPSLRASIQAWQIWNEPNHYPFVQPVVDVGMYTRMLKRAYYEIKHVDPAATVIAGGTAPAPNDPSGRDMAPTKFLSRIYASGGKGFFDAFAHHPYSFPCNPLIKASWNAFTQTKFLHDVMVLNGEGAKKIWGTEAGAPTGADIGACTAGNPGRSVTEEMQAQYLTDYYKGWYGDFGSFTGPLFWFQIRDNGDDPNYYDDHFGLLRRDFTPKPAYVTMQRLLKG
ncbi:MAG: hypothetical protein ACXVJW_13810 [Acidimicrobiia bacterium]